MKHYIQFKQLSTGYMQGTVPPQFSKDNIKPIDRLGSDGIYYLDNRLSLDSMINKGFELCKEIGFDIMRYDDTILNSRVVYSKVF